MSALAPELAAILASPSLPVYADIINQRLAEESARRQCFYEEIRDEKAEFIAGEVILHSPALARHLEVKDNLQVMLQTYVDANLLGEVYGEKCLCVFPRNDYEPDVLFFGPVKAATCTPTTLKFPVPDFAVEILSESTEHRDRGVKFQDYAAQGVQEYWIIDAEVRRVEQWEAHQGVFQLLQKSTTGKIRSLVVPGFEIPVRAIFDAAAKNRELARILIGTPPATED